MAEVHWSVRAQTDLRRIREFVAESSASYAVSFATRMITSVENLRGSPRSGRVVPELGDERVREILVRGYRIMYSVEQEDVVILRIVHGARDLRRLIRRGEWTLE